MNYTLQVTHHKLIVGFITYDNLTAKYLSYFLLGLKEQTFQDIKILAIDNSELEDNKNKKYLEKYNIDYEWAGENIGFARGYNRMIRKAIDFKSEYFLVINPDIILEPNAIEKLVNELDKDGELGSVSPKILRWDFKNNKKTNIIDTCGIELKSGLRFVDVGQGEEDKGQFENVEILGPSGACGMYRLSSLEKVKQDDNFFDELMFMYKEDCDLAYRLFLAGFKSKLVSDAVVYHDRSATAIGKSSLDRIKSRKNKSKQVKKWSFLNQQIIFFKYWYLQNFNNKLEIIFHQIKILVYILFFEQYLLGELKNLWQKRKKIKIYR